MLSDKSILDWYAAFLMKIEKGKAQWGSLDAIHALDEDLRFRVYPSFKEDSSGSSAKAAVGNPRLDKKTDLPSDKPFYCFEHNKGKCPYPDSHDGKFNKKQMWLKSTCVGFAMKWIWLIEHIQKVMQVVLIRKIDSNLVT